MRATSQAGSLIQFGGTRRRAAVFASIVLGVLVGLAAPGLAHPARAVDGNQDPDAINHIVVLMQENRAFDHYFGQLYKLQSGLPKPPAASNPDPTDPTGTRTVAAFHKTSYCEVADLDHSWNGTHREIDGGKMDGFTAANATTADPTGSRTMGYYDEKDLPFYYALYNTFAIGDRYFASAPTQTFPNRFYLLAGTSFGHIRNDFPPPNDPSAFAQRTIFNLLDEAGITWKIYYSQIAFALEFGYVRQHAAGHVVQLNDPVSGYFADAAAGKLPQVAFVDPIFVGTANVENDEHPPSNIQVGQKFVAGVVDALFKSPNWSSSALFLTYDEHGGYFDHVPPPAAPVPDAIPPKLQAGDAPGNFDIYGVRVPAAVISPFAKPHFVSHVVHDHTSILRFIETRYHLPALTKRDLAADPMLEFFDFNNTPAFATPPAGLTPLAQVDPTKAAECQLTAPPPGGF
jgi:phospholipase C